MMGYVFGALIEKDREVIEATKKYIELIGSKDGLQCPEITGITVLEGNCRNCLVKFIPKFDCSKTALKNQERKQELIEWLKSIGEFNKQFEFEF